MPNGDEGLSNWRLYRMIMQWLTPKAKVGAVRQRYFERDPGRHMPVGYCRTPGTYETAARLSMHLSTYCHPAADFYITRSPRILPVGHHEPARTDLLIPDAHAPVPITALHLKRAYRKSQGNME